MRQIVGVLQVINHLDESKFHSGDIDILTALVSCAGTRLGLTALLFCFAIWVGCTFSKKGPGDPMGSHRGGVVMVML